LRNIKTGETPSFPGKSIEVWSFEALSSVDSDIGVSRIIQKYDYNVRKTRRLSRASQRKVNDEATPKLHGTPKP
jgi:hypothetical protein